jgi:hypothetical protein
VCASIVARRIDRLLQAQVVLHRLHACVEVEAQPAANSTAEVTTPARNPVAEILLALRLILTADL